MRRALSLTAVLSLVASVLTANGFDLVVYGAGVAGGWTTELTLANLNADETSFGINSRLLQPCPPGAFCGAFVTIPGYGSAVVTYPLPQVDSTVGAAYVYAGTGVSPAVVARAHVPGSCASVDLPVFHLADLRALDPQSLVLAGAISGTHGRTNLIVANVPDLTGLTSGPVRVGIEALSASGVVVGSAEVTVPFGGTVFLQDVVAILGGHDLESGQVRLTKLDGDGVMWAVMPVARADGSLSVSVPQVP